jgi:hypothetical protein
VKIIQFYFCVEEIFLVNKNFKSKKPKFVYSKSIFVVILTSNLFPKYFFLFFFSSKKFKKKSQNRIFWLLAKLVF